jgi:predicted ATPase/DNA-binding winged helix-turn-helix (wHTH) protein
MITVPGLRIASEPMSPFPVSVVHRFQGWEIRPLERVLLIDGRPARIGSRAFDLLVALAERPAQLVSKRVLIELVWPDVVVEENNLSVQITALRKLLGSQAIVNVSGLGYQLASQPHSLPAPPPVAFAAPTHQAATRLFGRELDSDALLALVGHLPLVTVVGTGGVGKTTLARAVVARAGPPRRDGVHWIDLTPLRAGERLLPLVAHALGVSFDTADPNSGELMSALTPLSALLVLDNCEHLLDEVVALLGPLLQRAPGLRWLATSQVPLHVGGETVYRLGPLEVPAPGTGTDAALQTGAVALFCERVRAADRRFEITPERLDMAVELCRQLDGLPLALEMAAARVATLGLQGVHDQIDQRLRLRASLRDAPARHHTLQQTYEWSYGLLTATEQCVFRRLEPFAGGFTANMAQQLCCGIGGAEEALDGWAMLDALSALVDKSLVQRSAPGAEGEQERLHLLESARDYARQQLDRSGELATVRRQHAQVVAQAFATAHDDLMHWRDCDWLARYLPERRNVLVALGRACVEGEPDVLARLVAALAQLDAVAQTPAEVVRMAVPMDGLARATPALRAQAFLELGWAHFLDGHRDLGTTLSLRALADFETLDNLVGVYAALMRLSRLYVGRPAMEGRARDVWARLRAIDERQVPLRLRLTCQSTVDLLFDRAHSIDRMPQLHRLAQQAGFDSQAAICRMNITDNLLRCGRHEEVLTVSDAMLEHDQSLLRVRAVIFHNRAHALVCLGRIDEARAAAKAVLRALPSYAFLVMDLFAMVAARAGRYDDAALLLGRSAKMKNERDMQDEGSEIAMIRETMLQVQRALGEQRAAELMREGALMAVSDVLDKAQLG